MDPGPGFDLYTVSLLNLNEKNILSKESLPMKTILVSRIKNYFSPFWRSFENASLSSKHQIFFLKSERTTLLQQI